ncbi:MAG TPA: GNAT family N-acetyltransferase [Candidatus Nanoarchaeia archaeon]|nr:GNAT family N-acetyltransferase [Candidatus Nanoarchaeia archaeon]
MGTIIRKGDERDFSALMGLIKELATFEKAPHEVTNTIDQMRKEQNLFGSIVAEKDGVIIGAAIYFFSYYTWVGKSLYLDDIYVKPEHRGNKVGSKLLRKVFELAKKENCKRLRGQVLDWNTNAIEFYKRRGAAISGEWLNCDYDKNGINEFLDNNR